METNYPTHWLFYPAGFKVFMAVGKINDYKTIRASSGEVMRKSDSTGNTVAKRLRWFEEAGLIERYCDGGKEVARGRTIYNRLTDKGKKVYERLKKIDKLVDE